MSASGRFTLFPPSIIYAGPTTLDLTSIQSASLVPGANINRVEVAGAVDAGANILTSANPVAMLGTRSLSALLAVVPTFTGLKLTGGGVLRFQQRDDDNAFFTTGGVHVTETFPLGYMTLETLEASQDEETGAVARCKICVLQSDGLTNPITRSVTANFGAAPVPAFGTEYYLGPTYYNSAQLPGILRVSVASGLTISPFRSDGAVFPTSCCVIRRRPVIRVTCAKISADAAASIFVRAMAGPFVVYLQKAVDAGSRVAVGSAVHVKVSASAGAWFTEEVSAQENDDASVVYTCFPTTVPTISAASTIP